MTITGWKLDPDDRERLLVAVPPRYRTVVADHVTMQSDHGAGEPPLPAPTHGRIVGHVDDGQGVEALVLEILGSTERTATGGTWHVTWSLGEGRAAKESNDVLAAQGWQPLDGGTVALHPATW